jgi:hypothetical protein
MTRMPFLKGWGAATAIGALVLAGVMFSSWHVRAEDDDHDGDARVRQGFKIAPVPLNLVRKNRELVGLGSYLVNTFDCNGCHSAGPQSEFTPSGNPYLLPPVFDGKKKVNPATYLGGGRDFGPFPSPSSSVNIISRNLTPDKTGLPEGGETFSGFRAIMRTGVDPDHLHPTCSATVTTNCLPFPFNGALLQIMPWVTYQSMTDHDLRAIYEYLSAIPCIAGPDHHCF